MPTPANHPISYDLTPLSALGLDPETLETLGPVIHVLTGQAIWDEVVLRYLTEEDLERLESLCGDRVQEAEKALWALVSERAQTDSLALVREAGNASIERFASAIALYRDDLKKLKQKSGCLTNLTKMARATERPSMGLYFSIPKIPKGNTLDTNLPISSPVRISALSPMSREGWKIER